MQLSTNLAHNTKLKRPTGAKTSNQGPKHRPMIQPKSEEEWKVKAEKRLELVEFHRPSQGELESGALSPSKILELSCWEDSAIAALINVGDHAAADRYNDDVIAAANIDPVGAPGLLSSSNPATVNLSQEHESKLALHEDDVVKGECENGTESDLTTDAPAFVPVDAPAETKAELEPLAAEPATTGPPALPDIIVPSTAPTAVNLPMSKDLLQVASASVSVTGDNKGAKVKATQSKSDSPSRKRKRATTDAVGDENAIPGSVSPVKSGLKRTKLY